jgi:hypothetical protein
MFALLKSYKPEDVEKVLQKKFRIVEERGFYYPQVRFLGIFWMGMTNYGATSVSYDSYAKAQAFIRRELKVIRPA